MSGVIGEWAGILFKLLEGTEKIEEKWEFGLSRGLEMGFERVHRIQCFGLAWPERGCLFFFVLVRRFIPRTSQWEFSTNKGNRESLYNFPRGY